MSRKTTVAYAACFEVFGFIFVGLNINIEVVMCDFEQAIRIAIHAQFPRARIAGCNTHFDRVSTC